jgi:hypothetical protein
MTKTKLFTLTTCLLLSSIGWATSMHDNDVEFDLGEGVSSANFIQSQNDLFEVSKGQPYRQTLSVKKERTCILFDDYGYCYKYADKMDKLTLTFKAGRHQTENVAKDYYSYINARYGEDYQGNTVVDNSFSIDKAFYPASKMNFFFSGKLEINDSPVSNGLVYLGQHSSGSGNYWDIGAPNGLNNNMVHESGENESARLSTLDGSCYEITESDHNTFKIKNCS